METLVLDKVIIVRSEILAAALLEAPSVVEIHGATIVLETHLNRDFMPVCPPNGHPLMVSCTLKNKDIPGKFDGIKMKRIYVINGQDVWRSDANLEGDNIFRNGPKWGPDIAVDVVCVFETKDETYSIVAKGQKIGSTC